jgi:EAL domain-containing protein (putative c-di-GMP-specific phosphodiesterase class I)/GGDEF domain-containing protein
MFMLVNAFMLVLYYLIGQRDSVTFDSLSGLPNEALLQRKLIRIFRFQSPHALIFLDIENFEYFSSLHGAPAAEQVLVGIGTFLKTMAASNEAFRLEGSRFCLCLPSKDGRLAGSVVQAVRQRMTQGWQVEGELLFVQVNFGVLHIPSHASTLAEYDQARKRVLSEITSVRKQLVFIFTKQDAFDQQRRMNVLSALRSSIRNPEQVMVHYQPIYDVATGRMVSAEALMRIKDEHLGFLNPEQFISLAEQSGLIVHLTKILLSKVCTLVRKNLGECALEYISVNSSHIAGSLISIIEQEQIAPKKIGFEITESVALRSYEKVSQVMLELSLRDIKFALDDFGTGYSNLKALMDLPYAYVKFDKSVIHAAMVDPAMLALLVDMLHTLGKVLIAEGVETEQQLEMVKSVGIERVQGFYYAKPMEEQAFLALVG